MSINPLTPVLGSWRKFRKAVSSWTRRGPENSHRVRPAIYKEAAALVQRLLDSPDDWRDETQLSTVSTIIGMVYGEVPGNTPVEEKVTAKNLQQFVRRLTEKARPGSNMMGVFPWLRFIPTRYILSQCPKSLPAGFTEHELDFRPRR